LLLHGGSEFRAATAAALLAKSAIPYRDQNARKLAVEKSGYLAGTRHELLSLALLESSSQLAARAHDLELIKHLVASHHGWCRPLAPVEPELSDMDVEFQWEEGAHAERLRARSRHGLARVDSDVATRFESLSKRYGHHGLAWLECILRLADHRRSEAEQEQAES
jgi:CRISPR-associated endonuclease/helicase Cas3